jgi:hypothetical protein
MIAGVDPDVDLADQETANSAAGGATRVTKLAPAAVPAGSSSAAGARTAGRPVSGNQV